MRTFFIKLVFCGVFFLLLLLSGMQFLGLENGRMLPLVLQGLHEIDNFETSIDFQLLYYQCKSAEILNVLFVFMFMG